jgi:hypothetical protein
MKKSARKPVPPHSLRHPSMKPIPLLVRLAALLWFSQAAFAQAPDAEAIMRGARMSSTLVHLEKGLSGKLRQGFRSVPLHLFLMGGEIQFQFTADKQKPQIFHMKLGEEICDLFEIKEGKRFNLTAEQLVAPIAATDLTYEDLSLRFLYWPHPKREGSEDVAGQPCHKIRLDKPTGTSGRYQTVYVWVHEKFGAFLRICGHNEKGGLVKEFQVEDVMQIAKDTWTLRKMQVSHYSPENGRRTSITDVTFDTPNQGAPRGLR